MQLPKMLFLIVLACDARSDELPMFDSYIGYILLDLLFVFVF
jgi:hypothetical protein